MPSPALPDPTAHYTSTTLLAHRQQWGQFFTEPRVADFMTRYVLSDSPSTLFDPAFGLGAFYQAAQRHGFGGRFGGCEIDGHILAHFCRTEPLQGERIDPADYLLQWGQHHAAIVCNPPYQRFQKFGTREQVLQQFVSQLGLRLTGHTNIASAFLAKSICELEPGGKLAYLMPLEFVNAGYGSPIKRLLLEQGRLHAMIALDCEKEAFPEVTTSLGIILFQKHGVGQPNGSVANAVGARAAVAPSAVASDTDWVDFYTLNQIGQLANLADIPPCQRVPQHTIIAEQKWLAYFRSDPVILPSSGLLPLSHYGGFSRGIATGANHFFTLKPSQVAKLGLSPDELLPCISKSAQVQEAVFEASGLAQLLAQDAQVWLLNPAKEPSVAAQAYLASGQAEALHLRYLTRTREPWYKLEKRQPCPIWFGVFSRAGYKVIRNHSHALHLTCYHGFTPNSVGQIWLDHLFLFLHSRAGRVLLAQQSRQYGAALNKFEPSDLNRTLCPCPAWFEQLASDMTADMAADMAHLRQHGVLSPVLERRFDELLG